MRRNWRGRGFRSNWSRPRNKDNDNQSHTIASTSGASGRISSTAGSIRPPANQAPIIVPIAAENNVWKLYLPLEGKRHYYIPKE